MMSNKIAIIGLGYVGLPLALEFSKKNNVIGFDINSIRISELNKGIDNTLEADTKKIINSIKTGMLKFSSDISEIKDCNIFIITVPTPINHLNQPDLQPLLSASNTIGTVLKKDDIVIYESTTYPGCTEEDCVPVLEKTSNLKYNKDFYVGYSPERINPGDKINTLTKIKKVTSGSTPDIAYKINQLYASIIEAGTHMAPSIKVAEASKIIENCQRDINISFMNELALIFDRMGIDTNDVIDAAGTKWNFLKFKPGLVGGHCISVDPYYLVAKAESLGYIPNLLVSGRKINNAIAPFIARKVMKMMIEHDLSLKNAKILILGITFKENCPDLRNTKVADIYNEFKDFGLKIDVYDPWANPSEVKLEYDITLLENKPDLSKYQATVLTVSHDDFKDFDYSSIKETGHILFDTKGLIDRKWVNARL